MLAALVAGLAMLGQNPQDMEASWNYLGDPKDPATNIALFSRIGRLDPPKFSPKKFGTENPQPFEFDWLDCGYGRLPGDPTYRLRVRVFSQQRKADNKAASVARMMMRLWDMNLKRFLIDTPKAFNNGIVDVYLCWGGTPGGEQLFGEDVEGTPPMVRGVNTIYIYDLASFTDPAEMAREVAHEFGHATLPAVGGFGEPEDWGNGDLGEKIFMRWMRDAMKAGKLGPDDAMGASTEGIDAWVKKNVDAPVAAVAKDGPLLSLIEGTGQGALDAFAAMGAYLEQILPRQILLRAFKLAGSFKAADFNKGLLPALEEANKVVVDIPASLKGKPLWLPVGKGKVLGGTILKRNGDWAQVRPNLAGALTLVK